MTNEEYRKRLNNQRINDSKLILTNTEKLNKEDADFKKTLIPIITVILGLIVSLKDSRTETTCNNERVAFIFTVSICGLCILFGVISLYKTIHTGQKIQNLLHKEIQKDELRNLSVLVSEEPSNFFLISDWIFYFLFVSSIISLMTYAMLI